MGDLETNQDKDHPEENIQSTEYRRLCQLHFLPVTQPHHDICEQYISWDWFQRATWKVNWGSRVNNPNFVSKVKIWISCPEKKRTWWAFRTNTRPQIRSLIWEFKVQKLDTMTPISLAALLFLLNQNRMDQETNQGKSGYLMSLVWVTNLSHSLWEHILLNTHSRASPKTESLDMVNRTSKGKQIPGTAQPYRWSLSPQFNRRQGP